MRKLAAKKAVKILEHKMGDKHFISGVECEVRFLNAGTAWVCPTHDCEDEPLVARHIAYARIDETGKVTLI